MSSYSLNCEPEKQVAANVTTATTDKINHTLSNILSVAKYSDKDYYKITSPALGIEAERDLGKLSNVINDFLFNPKNWIVVTKVDDAAKTIIFKPLNIALYRSQYSIITCIYNTSGFGLSLTIISRAKCFKFSTI